MPLYVVVSVLMPLNLVVSTDSSQSCGVCTDASQSCGICTDASQSCGVCTDASQSCVYVNMYLFDMTNGIPHVASSIQFTSEKTRDPDQLEVGRMTWARMDPWTLDHYRTEYPWHVIFSLCHMKVLL